MALSFETLRFSVDLMEATRNLVEFAQNIDRKHPELFEEEFVKNAIKRYECFWLPFRVTRTALIVPPIDVHVVWIAHMLNPTKYREDTVAAVGVIPDHHLMTGEDLRASRKISKRIWARAYSKEPYCYEFCTKNDRDGVNLPDYRPLSQCDFMSNVERLKRFANFGELLDNFDELANAVEEYRKFFCLFQEVPETKVNIPQHTEVVWSAHQAHPMAYARDCKTNFHDRFLVTEPKSSMGSNFESVTARKLWEKNISKNDHVSDKTLFNSHDTFNCMASLTTLSDNFQSEYC